MKNTNLFTWLIISVSLTLGTQVAFAQNDFWEQTNGPYGGSVQSLAINSSGDVFAGGTDGVHHSTDNGDSWTQLTNTCVNSLAINSSGDVFAGTDGAGVFRSTDNGGSWTEMNNGLTDTRVNSLAINNTNGDVFAGTWGARVFRSTDNGGSWTEMNTGLTNTRVNSLTINSDGDVFAGTWGAGVFRSTDNGDSWTAVNSGLTNTSVLSLAINSSGRIFAGTNGSGVFRSMETTVSVQEIAGEIPMEYALEQNYPNPFNPITTIRYDLPEQSNVSILIYDILGREIRKLVNTTQDVGYKSVVWDGTDEFGRSVGTGIYLYQIKAGDFFSDKKDASLAMICNKETG